MSKAIMEFDLGDPASKEQHEHAADGHRYYRVLEGLADRFNELRDSEYQELLQRLGRKHSVPRVRELVGRHEGARA